MPNVPFAGLQTITATNVGQPVFGTTTTAAASPTYDQFVGNVTGSNPSTTTLAVVSTNGFNPGQYILVGLGVQLGSPMPNLGIVKSIISSTSMTVQGLNQSVASGAFVLLNESAQSISITPSTSDTGQIYIGTKYTTAPGDSSIIASPVPGQTFHAETADKSHAYNTTGYFIAGTINDTFIAQFTQG